MRDILILVHGMGGSSRGDCFAWAAALYPEAEQFERETRRWLEFPDGRQIYLLEVFYEDFNQMIADKYGSVWEKLFGGDPADWQREALTCVSDVVQNILIDASIDNVQSRFVGKYLEAQTLAQALVGPAGNPRSIRIAVLCHSLGTMVAYEGLYRATAVAGALPMHPVRLVACAPMWNPIRDFQIKAGRRRYLVTHGLTKPGRTSRATNAFVPLISWCTAVYRSDDPFLLIQGPAQYHPSDAANGLVDEYVLVDAGQVPNPTAHGMSGGYLKNPDARAAILRGLF